ARSLLRDSSCISSSGHIHRTEMHQEDHNRRQDPRSRGSECSSSRAHRDVERGKLREAYGVHSRTAELKTITA
ncbi:hypothetical protein PMAYCL1PPCAC_16722, partial [Pristionchus mayeri]